MTTSQNDFSELSGLFANSGLAHLGSTVISARLPGGGQISVLDIRLPVPGMQDSHRYSVGVAAEGGRYTLVALAAAAAGEEVARVAETAWGHNGRPPITASDVIASVGELALNSFRQGASANASRTASAGIGPAQAVP